MVLLEQSQHTINFLINIAYTLPQKNKLVLVLLSLFERRCELTELLKVTEEKVKLIEGKTTWLNGTWLR